MDFVSITGVGFPISKIVLGTISLINDEESFKIYDVFFSVGGNCVDMAHIYNDGLS